MNIAIMGSGKGSNAEAIFSAIADGTLPAKVVALLSDVPDAGILHQGARYGINGTYIDAGPYRTKLDGPGEQRYLNVLLASGADTVVLAGFMRIIKHGLLKAFPNRIVNIHPSLLPAFPGLDAWRQALDYGVKVTGCTVHLVDEGTDTGPILEQMAVPVRDDDTAESLHARIQVCEHRIYPSALRRLATGSLRFQGRRLVAIH